MILFCVQIPSRLRIVFDNLLSNAIKYSPANGTITVSAKKNDNHVLLSVIDEGPGVADEEMDNLFDPFYRGQAVAAGVVKRLGVGIVDCQRTCTHLGRGNNRWPRKRTLHGTTPFKYMTRHEKFL
jgi:signal transduction histidine kinase